MKNDGFDLRFDGDGITNDQTFGNSANSYYIYIYYVYIIWMGNSPTKISDITNPEINPMFALLVSC